VHWQCKEGHQPQGCHAACALAVRGRPSVLRRPPLPARAQMIKWKQAGMHMESFGMDLTNPDFVAHAESMGARGHRLTSVRGLLGRGGPAMAGRMQAKRTTFRQLDVSNTVAGRRQRVWKP
jgi:hypothetical protein